MCLTLSPASSDRMNARMMSGNRKSLLKADFPFKQKGQCGQQANQYFNLMAKGQGDKT